MSVEVCSYRLTMRGKPVGTHVLKTENRGRFTRMEGKSVFQGGLGNLSVAQSSRSHSGTHHSLRFREETHERSENRTFDVAFDEMLGIVRASRGPRDVAETPYIRPYRDPLSLLNEIRNLGERGAVNVAMLGKDVSVQYVGDVDLSTSIGHKRARAYLLHPGQSVVYVDVQSPHTILKLTQRLADGHVDALLVRVASEPTLDAFGEEERRQEPEGRGGKKRRGRRKPRRRRRA
jgi:hypothetical protein